MAKRRLTILPVLAVVLCGTFPTDLPAQELSGPEENFEYLWNTYDRNYALFGPKRVDWDALYRIYRPQVTAQTTAVAPGIQPNTARNTCSRRSDARPSASRKPVRVKSGIAARVGETARR